MKDVMYCTCKYPLKVAGEKFLETYCGKCMKDFKPTPHPPMISAKDLSKI